MTLQERLGLWLQPLERFAARHPKALTAAMVTVLSGSAITAFADASGNATTKVVNAGEQFSASTGQTGAIAPATLTTLNGLLSQTSISADGETAAASAQSAQRKGAPGGAPYTYENTGEKVSRNLPSN